MIEEHVYKTEPYAHQREAFELSRDRDGYALLMEMGTGKSKVLVDTVAWLFNRGAIQAALIIVPKSVVPTWTEQQLPEHLPDSVQRRHIVAWRAATRAADREAYRELFEPDPLCLKVLVMNVEALSQGTARNPGRAFLLAEAFVRAHRALVAVDESTTIKAPDATRTKMALKLGRLAAYRRVLTGTPVTQSPLDVFTQFEFLQPGALNCESYYGFRNRYAVTQPRWVNGRRFEEVVGYRRLDELQRLVLRRAYRKLKSECLDLPPKVYETRTVEPSEVQERLYRQLKEDAVMQLSATEVVTAPLVLTKLLRLRQVLAGVVPHPDGTEGWLETPRLRELLALSDEVDGKAIIWTSFVEAAKQLERALNLRHGPGSAEAFYGEIKLEDRQNIVNRFQDPNDPLRFFVGQVRTGGMGITLTAARTVIYHDHDWSLEARQQSEDRAHRIGQAGSVTYVDLVAPGTVDEVILGALKSKHSLADMVTGDNWRRILA